MADLTFNLGLVAAAFVGMFVCRRRYYQVLASTEEMRKGHQELLGEIQHVLANISGDIDRLHHLIPEDQAPEARQITQGLVRSIDQIILITRGDDL
jgi:hypothetical protein